MSKKKKTERVVARLHPPVQPPDVACRPLGATGGPRGPHVVNWNVLGCVKWWDSVIPPSPLSLSHPSPNPPPPPAWQKYTLGNATADHVVGDDTFPSQAPSCGQLSDTGREFLTPERGVLGGRKIHAPVWTCATWLPSSLQSVNATQSQISAPWAQHPPVTQCLPLSIP